MQDVLIPYIVEKGSHGLLGHAPPKSNACELETRSLEKEDGKRLSGRTILFTARPSAFTSSFLLLLLLDRLLFDGLSDPSDDDDEFEVVAIHWGVAGGSNHP